MTLLLNTTIKISLIVLIALAATMVLRRRSAAIRHFVLAAALACAAATPAVRFIAPAWQTSASWFDSSRLRLIDRPLAVFDDTTPAATAPARAPAPGGRDAAAVMRGLRIIWITGAGASLFVLLIGLGRLSWIAAHATRVTGGPWFSAASDISRQFGLRSTPALLQTDQPSVLGTWGIIRSTILLPAEASTWPADRIRIVLAHELAHVRRGDWMVQTGAAVLVAAYWFNPLVWLAARRLRLESEQACDDVVLKTGVEGSEYASELVDLARAFKADRQRFVPAAAIARPSSLERRVRAMLNVQLNRDPITKTASVAAALVLAIVTVLVAGFGVSAQSQFATISGLISDQNGRPISGVRLVLANLAAETKHELKSDAAGYYEIVGVPAGTYDLFFESMGMATIKREGLNLVGGQAATVNAVMRIGSIEETISVVDAPDGPQTPPRVRDYSGARVNQKPDPCAASAQGGCIRPPTKIKDVRPVYPAGVPGGVVELQAVIGTNGQVSGVEVKSSPDPALSAAAADAVSRWEYLETHLDGEPIETRMNVHVRFVAAK